MADYWREAALVIAGLWLGALSFFGKRELTRKDREIERLFDKIEQRDKAAQVDRGRLHEKLDSAISSIADVRDRVSRVEGRLNNGSR